MENLRYFCIRGFMKSGTNWLGSLLSSHESISVVGEYHWQRILEPLFANFKSEAVFHDEAYRNAARTKFDEMVKSCLASAAEPNSILVGERTPHTLAPVVLRDAPHVSIVRDGRDVLVSRAFHLYNEPQVHRLFTRIPAMAETLKHFQADPWFFQNNPDQLLCHETMVRESMIWWRDHLKSDRETVKKNPKMKVKFVKYEELHRDTQGVRAELFDFLGVDPKRCAEIEGHLKPGFEKERPTEFLRKGVVGDWVNYFTDDTKKWFKDEAGEELITQGYVADGGW